MTEKPTYLFGVFFVLLSNTHCYDLGIIVGVFTEQLRDRLYLSLRPKHYKQCMKNEKYTKCVCLHSCYLSSSQCNMYEYLNQKILSRSS